MPGDERADQCSLLVQGGQWFKMNAVRLTTNRIELAFARGDDERLKLVSAL
jgi:hypothetical protein